MSEIIPSGSFSPTCKQCGSTKLIKPSESGENDVMLTCGGCGALCTVDELNARIRKQGKDIVEKWKARFRSKP